MASGDTGLEAVARGVADEGTGLPSRSLGLAELVVVVTLAAATPPLVAAVVATLTPVLVIPPLVGGAWGVGVTCHRSFVL